MFGDMPQWLFLMLFLAVHLAALGMGHYVIGTKDKAI
jgi:hypothetical protein